MQPGFSVDNETSYSTDMFGEMRAAFFVQRALATNRRVNKDPDAPAPVMTTVRPTSADVNAAVALVTVRDPDEMAASPTERICRLPNPAVASRLNSVGYLKVTGERVT